MNNFTNGYAPAEPDVENSSNISPSVKSYLPKQVDNPEVEALLQSTMQIFEDISQKGEDSVFIRPQNTFWLTNLPPEILDIAKHIWSVQAPESVIKLERMLPRLERSCPEIRILRHTTPYSQMKYIPQLPPRLTKPDAFKGYNSSGENQPIPKNNVTNPIKRQELSVGTIYSMAANGARKEEPMIVDRKKLSTNPFGRERIDDTMFGYDQLYPNQTFGNIGI